MRPGGLEDTGNSENHCDRKSSIFRGSLIFEGFLRCGCVIPHVHPVTGFMGLVAPEPLLMKSGQGREVFDTMVYPHQFRKSAVLLYNLPYR